MAHRNTFIYLTIAVSFAASNDLLIGPEEVPFYTNIFDKELEESPAIWRQVNTVTFKAKDNEVISKINVTDLRPEKDGEVQIKSGGVGLNEVSIELMSPTVLRGYRFHIIIVATPKYLYEEDIRKHPHPHQPASKALEDSGLPKYMPVRFVPSKIVMDLSSDFEKDLNSSEIDSNTPDKARINRDLNTAFNSQSTTASLFDDDKKLPTTKSYTFNNEDDDIMTTSSPKVSTNPAKEAKFQNMTEALKKLDGSAEDTSSSQITTTRPIKNFDTYDLTLPSAILNETNSKESKSEANSTPITLTTAGSIEKDSEDLANSSKALMETSTQSDNSPTVPTNPYSYDTSTSSRTEKPEHKRSTEQGKTTNQNTSLKTSTIDDILIPKDITALNSTKDATPKPIVSLQ